MSDLQQTHHEECWRQRRHHDCAVAKIERLQARVEALVAVHQDWRKGVELIASGLGESNPPNLSCVRLKDVALKLRVEVDRLKQALTVEGDTLLNAQYWSVRQMKENKLLNDVYEAAKVVQLSMDGYEVDCPFCAYDELQRAIAAVQEGRDQ